MDDFKNNIEDLMNKFWVFAAMISSCAGAFLIHEGLMFIFIGFYILAFVFICTPTSLITVNLLFSQEEIFGEDDDEEESDDTEIS